MCGTFSGKSENVQQNEMTMYKKGVLNRKQQNNKGSDIKRFFSLKRVFFLQIFTPKILELKATRAGAALLLDDGV